MIRLGAKPNDDLDWKGAIEMAKESKGPIIWEFDLGLHEPYFPIEDELHFHSLAAGLTHFTKEVWPQFEGSKAILYRGGGDFSTFFKWSEKQEENFEKWKGDRPSGSEEHLKRLFCAEAFVNYFQMLAHRLPDEMEITLVIDPQNTGTLAEMFHLLSPERFAHFNVDFGRKYDSNVGVCFPEDSLCSREILEKIDALLPTLKSYRPIYESLMTEQWDGLDEIIIFPEAVSSRGKRKLLGFTAAGGEVLTDVELMGIG